MNQYRVFNQILGISMDCDSIDLGCFTIYHPDSPVTTKAIEPINLMIKNQCKNYPGTLKNQYIISVDVAAKDKTMAIASASAYFRTFDFVLAFLINDVDTIYNFGVYSYKPYTINNCLVMIDNAFTLEMKVTSPQRPLSTDDLIRCKTEHRNAAFNLISKKNRSEIENRLINSIEWIGKALFDTDVSKSFVMYWFSIESMLQYYEKNQLLTPSILHQLSESIAFILCSSYPDRLSLVKLVRTLYGKRSSLVHGGCSVISKQDVASLNEIAVNTVKSFIENSEFAQMLSIEDLKQWLSVQRFTSPSGD